ncbi:MAG: hypothetical protein ACTHJT_10340 [Cytophaga sp.]|uniref:hypothetical protein n=1 Tax=Cytophaga sp. TaxID=29535 RepID=UPI003F81279A
MTTYKLYPVQYTNEYPRWVIVLMLVLGLCFMYATDHMDIILFMNIRCCLWLYFYYTCYKSGLLTRFGYIMQFVYTIATSFASLTFFYVLCHYLKPEYLDWFGYNDYKDIVIKQTNDYIYLYASVLVTTFILCYPQNKWRASFVFEFTETDLQFYRKVAIVLFVSGYVSLSFMLAAPHALHHLFHVGSLLSLGAFPILLIVYKTYKENGMDDKAQAIFWLLILLVFLFGGTAFLFKGSKGKLFNVLVFSGLFSITYFRFTLVKLIGYFSLITLPLFYFLPFFLDYKNAASQGKLSSTKDRLEQLDKGTNSIEDKNTKLTNQFDYTINYISIRAIMGTVTLKYTQHALYLGDGNSSLVSSDVYPHLVETVLPRFLIRNKFDFNAHYNDVARMVGIGNYNDTTTSRKPNVMEEAIIVDGQKGIVIFAIISALFLVLLTRISLANSDFAIFSIVFVCISYIAANLVVLGDMLSFMIFQAGVIFVLLLGILSLMKYYKLEWTR